MEVAQEREWAEAQKIVLSIDIAAAAKQHLRFLAAVEENGHLYEGPTLQIAINRYNACWLPLLAKHTEAPLSEEPLVVPLDCEWIWHCHRLNPLRYISDCKLLFGRLLDNRNVVSSIEGHSKTQTEEMWSKMYPEEPYELDFARDVPEDVVMKPLRGESFTDYDLYSAAQRQRSFYYQVSRPHMSDDGYLQESVARYKAFLYLMKKDMGSASRNFCVPTYDIDLIWHTHQLHPSSYCEDLIRSIGVVADHDDTDSDRSEGKKLNVGFKETTQQWEEIFGKKYWRMGAMLRGTAADGPRCGGKCGGGGKCKGVAASCGTGKCTGNCWAVAAGCGGGKCSGKCKAVAAGCGGGKCSGKCRAVAASCGGGKCSGKCKGVAAIDCGCSRMVACKETDTTSCALTKDVVSVINGN